MGFNVHITLCLTHNFDKSVYGVALNLLLLVAELVNNQPNCCLAELTLNEPWHSFLGDVKRECLEVFQLRLGQFN
jgi:hypothetical protein